MNLVAFRTIQIDGPSIFYREAGAKNAETLLLLHGLPSSSRMFEPLYIVDGGPSRSTRQPMKLLR